METIQGQHCLFVKTDICFMLKYRKKNVTETVVKGTVLVLILQIELHPTSCQ